MELNERSETTHLSWVVSLRVSVLKVKPCERLFKNEDLGSLRYPGSPSASNRIQMYK